MIILNVSKHRFEFFSDSVMAIIITIMVLEIPLPTTFDYVGIMNFLYSIFIFVISFFIVGFFWNKHHWLIDQINEITNKIVWKNMVFLLFLALLPIFTKWVLENPTELIPVIFYDILFIFVNLRYFNIAKEVYKENSIERKSVRKNNKIISQISIMMIILLILSIIGIFVPQITIILLIGFPVISSIINIIFEDKIEIKNINSIN